MSGFVSFVSSGPGDPELYTLKAISRIKEADVVLYDDLSSGPILDYAKPEADLVAVGKRAGQPSAKQDHINRLLLDYAAIGQRIVRLKSGDAGVFGRLEEEITAMRSAGVGYEIIPGITTASAAAAAAGVPLTRREEARRVQFVTGHGVTGELPEDLNLAALADPKAMTALYMGKRTFAALAEKLIAAGLPADTPAMLAEDVGRTGEAFTRSTVAGLAKMLPEHESKAAGLILYGALMDEDG